MRAGLLQRFRGPLAFLLTFLAATGYAADTPVAVTLPEGAQIAIHGGVSPGPIVLVLPGGFWQRVEIGAATRVCETWAGEGRACAVLHPRSPTTLVVDGARAVAALAGRGHRPVFLLGHAGGAQAIAQLACHPQRWQAAELTDAAIGAAVLVSGLYDLRPGQVPEALEDSVTATFGGEDARRNAASPSPCANAPSFPVTVLAADRDVRGLLEQARDFTATLAATGAQVRRFTMPGRDHVTVFDPSGSDNQTMQVWRDAFGVAPLPAETADALAARITWMESRVLDGFWAQPALVETWPVDQPFADAVTTFFFDNRKRVDELSGSREYQAIALERWLEARGKARVGKGRFLTLTNRRGEREYWDLGAIRGFEPLIVVGIDSERHLDRYWTRFRARREYSWQDPAGPMPAMARALGAFIVFRKPVPAHMEARTFARYSLTPESFHLDTVDPLAPLADIQGPVREVITWRNACLSCHSLRGVGARSGHQTWARAEPHGGFALPLESYAPEVWRAFVFDQEKVAEKLGLTPQIVAPEYRQALYELVDKTRREIR